MTQEIINKIEENWKLFVTIIDKVKNDDVRESLKNLSNTTYDRLAAAPASTRIEFVGAYPGGLVEYSLNVLRLSKDIAKAFRAKVETDSLILTSLFHDIGKIGNEENDYYLEQTSDWHKNRGMMYEINPELPKVHPTQRSLWWLNWAGCPMTEDEIVAISSLTNMGQMYSSGLYEAPMLSVILQTAVRVACIQGTNKTSVLDKG